MWRVESQMGAGVHRYRSDLIGLRSNDNRNTRTFRIVASRALEHSMRLKGQIAGNPIGAGRQVNGLARRDPPGSGYPGIRRQKNLWISQ